MRRMMLLGFVLAVLPLATVADAAPTPNDPLYVLQWGPQQVHAQEAWDISTGTGAVIAIVESGIDLDHPELVGNVLPGNTFVDCGDSGCGNGDWAGGEPHGTHVAGIAAAVTNNGVGIAGVAPDADLLAVRAL